MTSRLICEDDRNKAESQDESEANELDNDSNNNQNDENLFERLQAHVEQLFTHSTPIQSMTFDERSRFSQFHTVIKQEVKLLEATGKKPSKLEQLLRALSSIPPMPVEEEQAFSAAGLFALKIKSKFGDKSVRFLCSQCVKQIKVNVMHLLFVRLFLFCIAV